MPWNQKTTLRPPSNCKNFNEETVPSSSSSSSCLFSDPDTSIRSVTKIDRLQVRVREESASLNQPQLHEQDKFETSSCTELHSRTVRNNFSNIMAEMSTADPLPPPQQQQQQQSVEKPEHFRYDSNSTETTATTTMTRSPSSPAEDGCASPLVSSSRGRWPTTTSEPHPTEITGRVNAPLHPHQQQKASSAAAADISGLLRPIPHDETVLSLRDLYTDLEHSVQVDRQDDENNYGENDESLRRRSSYFYLEDDTYGNEDNHNDNDEEYGSIRPRNTSEGRKQKSSPGEVARCDTPPNCLDAAAAAPPPPPDASASAALQADAEVAAGAGGASLSSSWSSSGVSSSAASTAATMALYHRPVAYCAIGGSLEDPSGNSFGWRQQVEKAYLKQQQQLGKYEFSSTLGLLPPPNHLLQQQQPAGKKKKNGIMPAYCSNPTLSYDATPVTRTSKKSLITANAEHYANHSKAKADPVESLTGDASSLAMASPSQPVENSKDTNRSRDPPTLATDTGCGGAAGAGAAPVSFSALPAASASSTTPGRKLDKRKQTSSSSPATGAETLPTRGDLATEKKLTSNLRRKNKSPASDQSKSKKKVIISTNISAQPQTKRKSKNKAPLQPPELFRPSSDAYTPRMGKKEIKYKPAEMRTPVQKMASPLGTLQRPNFRDALRRVAMILHQHVVKIERRFENKELLDNDGLFKESMQDVFHEENYKTPTYKCTMVRVPMARPGMVYGLKRIRIKYVIPTEGEIYEFAHQLFKSVQLSSECSIVCLIYVERLMEVAKVPLLATTWRPIFICGLLLASKVWQDLSSWNVEFASVYPQYSLESINRLELEFLRRVKWDLYISSSSYAKYYFALRSLVEKPDFRQRYNRMVGGVDNVQASEALKIEKRSSIVKEEALSQLSRSM